MKSELYCIIRGKVQGVMFRDFVKRKADYLNIVGTVENKIDGSVLIVAVGEKENLEKLLELLHKGPFLTRIKMSIEKVEAKFIEPAHDDFSNFKIIY